jgi:prephenate dehydrogenase
MVEENVCIVGLGLMGGSLALALRGSGLRVTGVDRDPDAVATARAAGAIVTGSTDLNAGLERATIVILATPVRTVIELLPRVAEARPGGCLVLDLGSTKQAVCEEMGRLPSAFTAVGGHPMCGRELAGFGAASASLYQDCTFVLTRTARSTDAGLARCAILVEKAGGRPLELPAERHDAIVAVTSHLPYMLAATLMRLAAASAREETAVWPVSASGLRDTTRLAGTEPSIMLDILLTNRAAVIAALRRFGQALDEVTTLLEHEDEDGLIRWLDGAASAHARYRAEKRKE